MAAAASRFCVSAAKRANPIRPGALLNSVVVLERTSGRRLGKAHRRQCALRQPQTLGSQPDTSSKREEIGLEARRQINQEVSKPAILRRHRQVARVPQNVRLFHERLVRKVTETGKLNFGETKCASAAGRGARASARPARQAHNTCTTSVEPASQDLPNMPAAAGAG